MRSNKLGRNGILVVLVPFLVNSSTKSKSHVAKSYVCSACVRACVLSSPAAHRYLKPERALHFLSTSQISGRDRNLLPGRVSSGTVLSTHSSLSRRVTRHRSGLLADPHFYGFLHFCNN